ncbi:hypothetical protein E2C01_077051 [Portunus trituberculatus]|uniref:Uncharacterized protein n=1 Tax=Portunus trituberculatus TaxID=210409 RepID=A0A5B7IKQ2_PORTR|nr:hypothetical protein [Portunus trituberculatus]
MDIYPITRSPPSPICHHLQGVLSAASQAQVISMISEINAPSSRGSSLTENPLTKQPTKQLLRIRAFSSTCAQT